MKEQELKQRVDKILNSNSYDPEAMHSNEDELRLEVIQKYCPAWVVKEINRLAAADFPRWCA